jgi:hypothetical protein
MATASSCSTNPRVSRQQGSLEGRVIHDVSGQHERLGMPAPAREDGPRARKVIGFAISKDPPDDETPLTHLLGPTGRADHSSRSFSACSFFATAGSAFTGGLVGELSTLAKAACREGLAVKLRDGLARLLSPYL